MVTRRKLLVGSAAVVGTIGLGATPAAAATAQARGAVLGFRLPGGLTCPVPYLSRAAWGADESWRFTNGVEDWPSEYHPVQSLTVHHTGFAASADPADTVRTIYRQQALTSARGGIQGWGDIGYNLLIDDAGVVYEGRHSGSSMPIFSPADRQMTTGAHVLYYNTGNIGVCLLGYLDDVPATQAAQDSLVTVLAYLAAVAGVNPLGTVNYYNPVPKPDGTHTSASVLGVSGHRNWAATDCPGSAFYPLLGGIRQRVAGAMPAAPPPPSTSQPTPSASPTSPQPEGSNQPSPSPSPNPPQNPPTTTSSAASSHSERGGDEYVAAARKASPSQFPTKAPAHTPLPTLSPESVASAVPSFQVTPTLANPPLLPQVAAADSPGWGVAATAAGIVVAGAISSVGGRWWRHRRTASAPGGTEPSIVDASTPGPSTVDEPRV